MEGVAARRSPIAFALASGAFASAATWAGTVVLAAAAYQAHGSFGVSAAIIARTVPAALLGPVVALAADRRSRRDVLLAGTAGSAVALGLLAAAAGAPLGPLCALAAVHGAVSSALRPSQVGLLAAIAPSPHALARATGLANTFDSGGFLAGAAGAGVVTGAVSPAAGFGTAGALALLATVAGLIVPRDDPPPHRHAEPGEPFVASVAAGAKAIVGDRGLASAGVSLAGLGIIDGAVDVLVAVVAFDLLAGGAGDLGALNAAWGAGGLVGGTFAAYALGHRRFAGTLAAGAVVVSASLVGIGAASAALVAGVGFAAFGAGFAAVESAAWTVIQRLSADDVLARALGAAEAAEAMTAVLGAALVPPLVDLAGPRAVLVGLAALLPLLLFARAATLREIDRSAAAPAADVALLRALDVFAPLPLAAVETLAARANRIEVADGATVIREGERGTEFFVVARGRLTCTVDDCFAREVEPGGYVGEIALLRDVPRTATVMASAESELLVIAREDFLGAIGAHRLAAAAARVSAESRLAADAARPRAPVGR